MQYGFIICLKNIIFQKFQLNIFTTIIKITSFKLKKIASKQKFNSSVISQILFEILFFKYKITILHLSHKNKNGTFILHQFVNSPIIYYIILYILHYYYIHSFTIKQQVFFTMHGWTYSLLPCCPDILPAEKIHKGKNVLKCVEMCAFDEQIPISGFDIV